MHSLPPTLPRHTLSGSIASALRGRRPGVPVPDVWRAAAVALVRLNAKEREALALLFEDEGTSDETRFTVLDLLARAGTHDAQVVLRRLLAHGVARRDSRTFAAMAQRLAAVERPDGATLRFLMSVYAESRREAPDVRAACAYALGLAAGHARAAGDEEVAVRASEILRRDLRAAPSAAERCALLTALGNVGLPLDAHLVVPHAVDPQPSVRAATAFALRKLACADARSQLVAMVADEDPNVAHRALSALADLELDADELERLAGVVLAGRTAPSFDARVLRLLTQCPRTTRDGPDSVESAVRFLLCRIEAAAAMETSAVDPHPTPPPVGPYSRPPRPLPCSGAYRLIGAPLGHHADEALGEERISG